MADITIMSHVANACTVHFHDPMLAIGWVRMIAHTMPVEYFMGLVKALYPGDGDRLVNTQHMIDYCMGAAA